MLGFGSKRQGEDQYFQTELVGVCTGINGVLNSEIKQLDKIKRLMIELDRDQYCCGLYTFKIIQNELIIETGV